ncbi:hypothetical protein MY11210_004963 [Beauveria gryllotalpidicola]
MASYPGGHDARGNTRPANLPDDAARTHRDPDKTDTPRNSCHLLVAEPQPIPATLARIPSNDGRAPRPRAGELHRRRSQVLYSAAGSESSARGMGVQKPAARPPEQAAAVRKYGSPTDSYRPGAAAAATRERMYKMLQATASAEDLAALSTSSTQSNPDDKQKAPMTATRPIAIPRTRRNVDVEMLDASMPPPPPMTQGNGSSSAVVSRSLPLEVRDELGAPSSNAKGGSGRGLKRSASNSSQTVTIIECPILEVDDQCGNDEDLSWLNNDQELEQMLALASSQRRTGRSSLAFKRSHEAAMQCSQVVRNVPRMRKRRHRKLDRRRLSLTLSEGTICQSEGTICLSSSPSPTATPVG